MFSIQWPKTSFRPLAEQDQTKVNRCLQETDGMTFKPVVCLVCKTHLFDAADGMDGYIIVKCQKCKTVMPVNPSYFKSSAYLAAVRKRNEFILPLEYFRAGETPNPPDHSGKSN